MAGQTKKTVTYFLILLSVLYFVHCANQLPPQGGDIDRIPPEIESYYPTDATLNYSENYFEIEFSEYVDKRSVKEAIFISPTIEGDLELDWSGRSVRVEFPGKLRENTTYNITIGTDVSDYNNKNKMSEAFNFSFSTGSKLDRRVVTGSIVTEKPQGILLYAYLNPTDTLNPSKHKPDYISQSGIDGNYKIPGLAQGTYRIFAVQDEFRDLLFNTEQDKIGIPYKDILLAETDTLYSGLNFFISEIDTVRPRLLNTTMTDRNHLVLSFSELIKDSSISSVNFTLYDSTLNKVIKPLYAYKNLSKPTEVFLAISDSIPEGNMLYVFADTVIDLAGNMFLSDQNSVTVSTRIDTLKPIINRMQPPSGNNSSDYQKPVFNFSFNDGVDSVLVKKNTTFQDTSGRNVNFGIFFADDANFTVYPLKNLEPSKDYIIKFNLRKIPDAAGNISDTLIQYRFKTISGLDFTGVSGKIEGIELNRNPLILLQGIDEKKITYQKKVTAPAFEFERIEPGTYRLWTYYDRDSSFTYSTGLHYPFIPSEEFSYYRDSLVLRPRWAITDIIFNTGN